MSWMLFTCPHCGDPSAETIEPETDIHAGATYRCTECGGNVVFEALTTDEYVGTRRVPVQQG